MTHTNIPLPPRLLRTEEAARLLGLSGRTLEKHRCTGTGPSYRKLGGRVLYALGDLQAWIDQGERHSTHHETPGRTQSRRALEQPRIAG
jgi:predicted DNA-binding transcriptional regulator AlpA